VALDLKNLLYEIADEYSFTIAHMEIGLNDHIHLLVNAPPKLSVTNIVRWLKGISARKLFQLHPKLQHYYFKPERERQLWSPSYFVESKGLQTKTLWLNILMTSVKRR
jgi:putative transposase